HFTTHPLLTRCVFTCVGIRGESHRQPSPQACQSYTACIMRRPTSVSLVHPLLLLSLTVRAIGVNGSCGQRPIAAPGTITGGQSSWPGQFPWHAALFQRSEPRLTVAYACGGFLVGDRAVITAAHCVTAPSGYQLAADELTVRLGLHDLLTLARHSQEHRVRTVHRHANFSAGSPRHDLALLALRTIVEFGLFVQPICLPRAGEWELRFGTVSGWGLTEGDVVARTLRASTMPLVSYIRCLESDSTLFGQVLYDGMFCAGWENGTNVCNGDSGGAFVANVNGSWTAYGIVSITGVREDETPFRCNTKSLAGFISTTRYLGWIESVAEFSEPDATREVIQSGRISETVCQWYRARCAGREDLSYLASVVRPVLGATPRRYARLVIDCYAVLISDRFLLAPASCYRRAALATQFIIVEVAGQAVDYRIRTFHQHPAFVNGTERPAPEEPDQSNLALIELERKVPLSTCQFVCLWNRPSESDTLPPNIFLYSAVNVSAGDKSIEAGSAEVMPVRPFAGQSGPSVHGEGRCYDELLAPMVMLPELAADGYRYDRLVGIVLERTCTKIRFIKVAPFVGWIEGIVWPSANLEANGGEF
uniref:Peptidase S1 domain-containing protein n=1 Tax=Anopheles dirus TaxID=7168 RepID=A0A182MZC0_9DIPT